MTNQQSRDSGPPQNVEASLAEIFDFLFVRPPGDTPEIYRVLRLSEKEIMRGIRAALEANPDLVPAADVLAEENKKRRETAERATR